MTTELKGGLTVEVQGIGTPVLCIHGLGGSSNTWTPVLSAFEGMQIVRPDLPGSARSELTGRPLSIDAYVDSLEALLADLEINSAHVVAHSLGTVVAQHLTVRNPDLVKSLVLFGPLVAPPEAARPNIEKRARLARTGAAGMQEIADQIVAGATSKETKGNTPVLALVRESVMRQPVEGYAQSCEALAAAVSAAIEQIEVPTLLVTGDQDGVAPPAHVQTMSARIPGSRVVVLSGCGHWTPFEKPDACIAELKNFYAAPS